VSSFRDRTTEVQRQKLTRGLIRATAISAAHRQMVAAGRTQWNDDDYKLATETEQKLNRHFGLISTT
jgi:hypothetical protein